MTTYLILGTAGHIDHGKTSLIRALTGTNTDRLPEEKKRGITIELGFAELDLGDYRLGIVDVPGHERFVRQMLAGATSIDLAILVVAADDSVKQQTREHFEVLKLLDLPVGVIAMTKCDLADPDWMELVEEEIRDLVAGSFLDGAEIVRTSAATGEGLDTLREALLKASRRAAEIRGTAREQAPFRMAIDRAFTVAGHGTVVTGSVSSGSLHVGDQIVLEPGHVDVRVRGLQNHDRKADAVSAGQRAAVNLVGVHHQDVQRGQEIACDGFLTPSQLMTVQLEVLPQADRPLKNRARVRLHLGTNETMAHVALLDQSELPPGTSGFAQLFLADAIVSSWNQAFVVRSESPVTTIGGGRVLVPAADKIKHAGDTTLQILEQLQSDDGLARAAAAVYFAGVQPWTMSDLARLAGVDDAQSVCEQLTQQGDLVLLKINAQRHLWWHRQTLEELCERIETSLGKMHDREPLRSTIDQSRLTHQLRYYVDAATLEHVLRRMAQAKRVRLTERGVGLAGRGPQLSKSETQVLAELIGKYKAAGFQPPTVKECEKEATKNKSSVASLISLAETEGDLVKISSDYYLHRDVEHQLRVMLTAEIKANGGLTLSQIREQMGTTRKYAVPICEHLDRIGFTKRDGDLRVLGPTAIAGSSDSGPSN